jgi:mono/diheme cytochrome c family protein
MRKSQFLWLAACAAASFVTPAAADSQADPVLARGRYIVSISGCNDCHTAGYPESGGKVRESDWLTGSPVGFSGPWGTTYPANLRLAANSMSEAAWIARARTTMRPPMPWFSLRDMSDEDLRAVYRYVRSLGPKGIAAPAFVPPGQKVATPYIEFFPKNLPLKSAAK